jgi:hypothetical protein
MECWAAIPDYEGLYEASDAGRIRSLSRLDRLGRRCGRILKPHALPAGYLQVGLSRDGKVRQFYVHRLVAATFIGPCPEGMEVRHWDGDPANNAVPNLLYGTHKDNSADMIRHGRTIAGTRHPFTRLTDADVSAIRLAWQQGTSGVALAAQYDISRAGISRIVKGRSFRAGGILKRPLETCHYPGCDRLAEDGTDAHGKALVFCPSPAHNRESAKNERDRLESLNRERPQATCPHCGVIFVKMRSDKVYCTRKCKSSAAKR